MSWNDGNAHAWPLRAAALAAPGPRMRDRVDGAAQAAAPGDRGHSAAGPGGNRGVAAHDATTARSCPPRSRVNCFTPGTRIMTPRGETPVEQLKAGDMVVTRDNGAQEIRWVGRKRLEGPPLRLDTELHPVLIRAGALGPDIPARDLRLSPGHRVLLLGDHPALDHTEAEVFVSARHLIGTRGIAQVATASVDYLHIMFDRHEVVLSEGAWTESFRPSEAALAGVEDRSREEILDLFPELRDPAQAESARPARPTALGNGVKKPSY